MDENLAHADAMVVDTEPCFELTADAVAYLATHSLAAAPADEDGSL